MQMLKKELEGCHLKMKTDLMFNRDRLFSLGVKFQS